MKKNAHGSNLSDDKVFLEALRKNPEMRECFNEILSLALCDGPVIPTVDEVEQSAIEKLRKLGNHTIANFLSKAETRVVEDFKKTNPKAKFRKKKMN